MPVRVFVSTENSADDPARRLIVGLEEAGLRVTCSPLNPAVGDDPRWRGWYETGCKAAIEATDMFVAIVTAGYDGSTWMAMEAETAWRLTRDQRNLQLFLLKQNENPLPAGFRRYEEAMALLPMDPEAAIAALLECGETGEDSGTSRPAKPPYAALRVGGPVDEFGACVAVYGEDLDPEAVSALLGCSPTSSHRRGDRRSLRSVPYKRGGWFLELRGRAPDCPDELVAKLLSQLPAEEPVWLRLGERYEVQLRLGIHMRGWNRGFDLSPALVAKAARLHARVGFDIYAYGDEEDSGGGPSDAP